MPDSLSSQKPLVDHGFLARVSFIAALGGVLYGYDMGIIAAAIIFVRHSFALSTEMEELVVSIVLVGAMVGAMVGGAVADRIGRRATLVWAGAIFIIRLGACAAFAECGNAYRGARHSWNRDRFHVGNCAGLRF